MAEEDKKEVYKRLFGSDDEDDDDDVAAAPTTTTPAAQSNDALKATFGSDLDSLDDDDDAPIPSRTTKPSRTNHSDDDREHSRERRQPQVDLSLIPGAGRLDTAANPLSSYHPNSIVSFQNDFRESFNVFCFFRYQWLRCLLR
jgi:hypothetical protein